MFEFNNIQEIWSTMKKNKLRTFLTGFSVTWGIFMLIVLLSAGNGLSNGIGYNFRNISTNFCECWTRSTSQPWQGLPTNRRIRFNIDDVTDVKRYHPEVNLISPVNTRNDTLSYNKEYLTGQIRSVYPDYCMIHYVPVNAGNGRFINAIDLKERRKVIVISPRMATVLFRDSIEPVGKYVRVGSGMYQVIGIYEDENKATSSPAYIPFTTGQMLFDDGYQVSEIVFTIEGVNTKAQAEAFEKRLKKRMAYRHRFSPDDLNAIGFYSAGEEFRMWKGMTNGIAFFIWIVGIGTLMAGIVGVSNIMLITVRERTKEFGIRKAIGAKPSSILSLIIIESVLVTSVFGYIGMVGGIGLAEGVDYIMDMTGANAAPDNGGSGDMGNTTVFRHPTVDLGISLAATGVLIIAGVLAGYFPARKAVKISAIDAIRND
ncbi:MAG: ABC transporter permease [Tannerellaceae bacterium]|jgi:putative ABC transport system permease protein|nr:ABC transporter permease [Tannerellaceae bacterium]